MNGPKTDYKVVIIGNSHVGKTTLLKKFIGKMDLGRESYVQKTVESHGRHINLQIHDTMGQERFRSLTSSFYRGSDGCLVCFDVMNQSTFDDLDTWLLDLKDYSGGRAISILLVGINSKNFPTQHKNISDEDSDLFLSQKVELSKIDAFREEHKLRTYLEVDLTSISEINHCFETITDVMIADVQKSQQIQQENIERNSQAIHIGRTTNDQPTESKGRCSC
ncbi:Calcium release activated channel regulator [Mactra antiquata]